jgi:hypothetical protein
MKAIKIIPVFMFLFLSSCSSVMVNSDYDNNVDFSRYKTFGFQKSGIDKVEISDLDKKRILRAIDSEMTKKGFTKSETPDLLINIFTKEKEQVDVNQFNNNWGFGWRWGWDPFMWGGQTTVTRTTEGTLFIDIIDATKKELIWQGEGNGYLTKKMEEKETRINEFVTKILAQYPPEKK